MLGLRVRQRLRGDSNHSFRPSFLSKPDPFSLVFRHLHRNSGWLAGSQPLRDRGERFDGEHCRCNLCFNHGWLVQAEARARHRLC